MLVGARDLATRSIRRGFASSPLDDFLTTERIDWNPTEKDRLNFRYTFQREEGIAASTLIRSIGSASQRQSSKNKSHSFLANFTHIVSTRDVNNFYFSFSDFINDTLPVAPGPQLTFPSIQDGASFRVPQQTKQRRFQFSDTYTMVRGNHVFNVGGEIQRVQSDLDLKVFQQGRVELIEDFPDFDRNLDGRVDDNDLLFAVTLRSGVPERALVLPDADNTYFAAFLQDDWRVHSRFTLNLGLRYELDTDVKNVSRTNELNPLILPFFMANEAETKTICSPNRVSTTSRKICSRVSRWIRHLLRSRDAGDTDTRARARRSCITGRGTRGQPVFHSTTSFYSIQ